MKSESEIATSPLSCRCIRFSGRLKDNEKRFIIELQMSTGSPITRLNTNCKSPRNRSKRKRNQFIVRSKKYQTRQDLKVNFAQSEKRGKKKALKIYEAKGDFAFMFKRLIMLTAAVGFERM